MDAARPFAPQRGQKLEPPYIHRCNCCSKTYFSTPHSLSVVVTSPCIHGDTERLEISKHGEDGEFWMSALHTHLPHGLSGHGWTERHGKAVRLNRNHKKEERCGISKDNRVAGGMVEVRVRIRKFPTIAGGVAVSSFCFW